MSSAAAPATLFARVRALALGGTASIAAGVVAANVLRIVSSMTLTRLLDSEAYGVVGIIMSITYMLAMVTDVGLTPFILRHDEVESGRFLDEIWTVKLLRGIGLSILMALVAWPAALFLGRPGLTTVIAVWGLSFTIDGLAALTSATAIREQKLWRLSMVELAANVVTLAASIVAALMLHSYWAMIVGMTAGQVARAIFSYAFFRGSGRRFAFRRERSRELWNYSRYIAASSLLSIVVLQADKVVLARMMPLAVYGFYAIATTLAIAPEALAGPYGQRVLLPIYTECVRARRQELRRVFYDARRRFLMLYTFAVGGMIGGAPLMIAILYDPRYRPVTVFLQLLALRVVLRLPNLAANEAMLALNDRPAIFNANVCRIAWLFGGGALALAFGTPMALVAVVATDEVPAFAYNSLVLRRERVLDLRQESLTLAGTLAGAAVGWAVASVGLRFFR